MNNEPRDLREHSVDSLAHFPEENPYPVLRLRSDGMLLFANDACNYFLKDKIGAVGEYVPDQLRCAIEKAYQEDKEYEWEVLYDSSVLLFSIVPIKNENYVNVYGFNITELKNKEKELIAKTQNLEKQVVDQYHSLASLKSELQEEKKQAQKKEQELQRAKRLADIGMLAAAVAHELRNPLGVIETALYNIRRKRTNEAIDRHIASIEKKAEEASQIITNLLLYARIKDPERKELAIDSLIKEVVDSLKKRFRSYNITVIINTSDSDTTVRVDPSHMREVFTNILVNAFQAYPEKKGSIEITISNQKHLMEITIHDYGVGIDEEALKHVFEPFYTKKSKGTGLGLSICHELIELHGGTISIASKVAQGTRVLIELPKE